MKIPRKILRKIALNFSVYLTAMAMLFNASYPAFYAMALTVEDSSVVLEQEKVVEEQVEKLAEESEKEAIEEPDEEKVEAPEVAVSIETATEVSTAVENESEETSSTEITTEEAPVENLPEQNPTVSEEIPVDAVATPEEEATEKIEVAEEENQAPEIGVWEENKNGSMSVWVEEGAEYEYKDSGLKIKFTRIDDKVGEITVKEIDLSEEQIEALNSLSSKAWDITSGMEDGTFEYELTLPVSEEINNEEVQIIYAEEEEDLISDEKVEAVDEDDFDVNNGEKEIVATMDHFTIFVVAETFDSTHGVGQIVNVSDNNKLSSSDDSRLESDDKWTVKNYNKNKFIEFRFNPNIPEGATLGSPVKLIFEYRREALALIDNNYKAQLLIKDQTKSDKWDILEDDVQINDPYTDKTFQIAIPNEYVDTIDEINNLKIRFRLTGRGFFSESGIKTEHDYVALDIDYKPAVPVHVSPSDKSFINDNDFWFDWEDVAGAVSYEMQNSQNSTVGVDGSFTNIQWTGDYQNIQPVESKAHSVGANGTWYWQVRAIDVNGNKSDWSTPWEINIDMNKPGKPVISKPSSEQYFTTTPILNSWSNVFDFSGIDKYRVWYSYDDNHGFSDSTCGVLNIEGKEGRCRDVDDPATSRNHIPNSGEQGGVTIRVQAIDNAGNEGEWSDPVHYFYDATAPAVPTGLKRLTPDGTKEFACGDFSVKQTLIPTWDKNTEEDFDHYEYTSFNPNGSIGINEQVLSVNKFEHTWVPTQEGVHGYSVRAVDKAGNKSAWAIAGKTLTGSCQITYDSTVPTTPVISGFKNPNLSCGAITNIKNITVDWNDSIDTNLAGYNYNIDYPLAPGPGRGNWDTSFPSSQYSGHLNEGIHHIKVQAKDKAGNVSGWSNVCSITYDSIAPDVPILNAPVNEAVVKGIPSLTNSWNAVDGAVKYVYESWHNTDTSNLANRRWEQTVDAPATSKTAPNVSNATFWWRVKAIDAAGNESGWSELWKVTVDNIAPTATVNYNVVSLTNNNVIATLNPNEPVTVTNNSGSFDYTFVSNGSFTFEFEDEAGNIGTALAEVNYIDKEAPVVEITNPTGDIVSGTVEIKGSVTDANPHHYWLVIQGPDGQVGPGQVNTNISFTDQGLFSWDTTAKADGVYTIKLEARDSADNKNEAKNVSGSSVVWKEVIVDNTDPTSTITGGENGETIYSNSWNGSISGTASDNLSGVAGAKISIKRGSDNKYWNGSGWTENEFLVDATGTGIWSYQMSPVPSTDSYIIRSHAIDNAGNIEDTYTLIIVYDKTIPEINLAISPASPNGNNNWYIFSPEITLTANDNTVWDKIEYQLNSKTGTWITYTNPVKIEDGQTAFYYRSWDKAGNESTIGVKNVKVDTQDSDEVKDVDAEYSEEEGEVKLSWDVEDSDIYKVYIYRGKSRNFKADSTSKVAENDDNDENYKDDNINSGEKYYYKLIAQDEAGNTSNAKVISVTIPAEEGGTAVVTDEGNEEVEEGDLINEEEGRVLGDQTGDGDGVDIGEEGFQTEIFGNWYEKFILKIQGFWRILTALFIFGA